jgi:tRNA threonylcarbamoyladenosine modification (KEOPS) complex Cgi121 subunit
MTEGILKDWLDEIAMRVFRIGRGKAAPALLKELQDAEDAVAIRAAMVQSLEELQLAYYLAERSFGNRTNVAKKLKFEFLLWLAGKTDIRSALEITAPKGAALAVVFADGAIIRKLEKLGAKEARLKKTAEPLALERISLSRLK